MGVFPPETFLLVLAMPVLGCLLIWGLVWYFRAHMPTPPPGPGLILKLAERLPGATEAELLEILSRTPRVDPGQKSRWGQVLSFLALVQDPARRDELETALGRLPGPALESPLLEEVGNRLLQIERWDLAEPVARLLAARPDGLMAGRFLLLQVMDQQRSSGQEKVLSHARRVISDRFQVDRLLGAGGMGYVVRATARDYPDPVAIKVLSPLFSYNREYLKRFQREIEAARSLCHPHIVKLLEVDLSRFPYFVMEYVPGPNLRQLLKEQGRIPFSPVLSILDQLARALTYAHERGVIHRDVKPENVLVGPDHTVKLIDFGLAKVFNQEMLTRPGEVLGSTPYMGPEQQLSASDVDHRVDVFSFAVLAYELVSGRLPYTEDEKRDLSHTKGAPPPILAGCPEALAAWIQKGLSPDPGARPPSPENILPALEDARRSEVQAP